MVVSTFDGLLLLTSQRSFPNLPEDSSIMPSCSSLNCISRSEHIIPSFQPRIFPTPIVVSIPGTNTPGFATTTSIPFAHLGHHRLFEARLHPFVLGILSAYLHLGAAQHLPLYQL